MLHSLRTALLLVMTVGASACGGNVVVDGAGGAGGTPCVPADGCSQCADNASCSACNRQLHPSGVPLYDTLVTCVLCGDCYSTCMAPSSVCPSPPATTNACDTGTHTNAACSACQTCATQGSCQPATLTCQNDPDCLALVLALAKCPSM